MAKYQVLIERKQFVEIEVEAIDSRMARVIAEDTQIPESDWQTYDDGERVMATREVKS
jgi:hypothetical protein